MKKITLIVLFGFSCFIGVAQSKIDSIRTADQKQFSRSAITYAVMQISDTTWGYHIYADNKLIIHQHIVYGIQGLKSFNTIEKAQKVAQLVVDKIKRGEIPPIVREKEIKQLGVLQ